MKVRSLDDLQDAMDSETAWRRRELTTIRFSVDASRESKQQVALRSGVSMLYAHWEGWIKATSRLYLEYVSRKSVPLADLTPGLMGAALKTRVSLVLESNSSTTAQTSFAQFIIDGGLAQPGVIDRSQLRTEANLSSTVLRSITEQLDLSFEPYELRVTLIDETLLGSRNRIAHGEYLDIDIDRYLELHDYVLDLLNVFTIDVLNAAARAAYRR